MRPQAGDRDVQSTIGGALFIIGSLVTAGGMLGPHSVEIDTAGILMLSAFCLGFGVVLTLLPHRLARHAPPLIVAAGVVAITWGLFLNGERQGGSPLFNELFYFWPTFYVGYFFTPRRIVATVAGIGAAYAAVLVQFGLSAQQLTPRYLIVMSSLVGMAVAMRMLRRRVDALVRKLKEVARTDVLTGLLNRRAFDEQLQHELTRSMRSHEPFALLLADVDHFKQINDRDGHAAGDDVLQRIAHLLTDQSRTIDTVARVGGEEFALILPGTDRQGGVEVAERLRTQLATLPGHRTMSIGVVEGPADGHTPDTLLRQADRALYAAKAAGRDRTFTPEGAADPSVHGASV